MLVKSGIQMSVDKTKADEVLTTINELTLDGWTVEELTLDELPWLASLFWSC